MCNLPYIFYGDTSFFSLLPAVIGLNEGMIVMFLYIAHDKDFVPHLMRQQTAFRRSTATHKTESSLRAAAGKHTITPSTAITRNYLFNFVFCVVGVLGFICNFFSRPSELSSQFFIRCIDIVREV